MISVYKLNYLQRKQTKMLQENVVKEIRSRFILPGYDRDVRIHTAASAQFPGVSSGTLVLEPLQSKKNVNKCLITGRTESKNIF